MLPTRAKFWAALGALFAALLAFLQRDARRNERQKLQAKQARSRLKAISRKQEIDRDAQTKSDTDLIDRISRR